MENLKTQLEDLGVDSATIEETMAKLEQQKSEDKLGVDTVEFLKSELSKEKNPLARAKIAARIISHNLGE